MFFQINLGKLLLFSENLPLKCLQLTFSEFYKRFKVGQGDTEQLGMDLIPVNVVNINIDIFRKCGRCDTKIQNLICFYLS